MDIVKWICPSVDVHSALRYSAVGTVAKMFRWRARSEGAAQTELVEQQQMDRVVIGAGGRGGM